MTAPRWAGALLRRVAPPHHVDDILGDLEEAHRNRVHRSGRMLASVLTSVEALDLTASLLWQRVRRHRKIDRSVQPLAQVKGRREIGISWLDLKLALRMLVKTPGLTVVGGIGMAVAIAIAAVTFGIVYSFMDSDLPLDEGDRVVAIQIWDARIGNPNRRSLHDFLIWRDELQSVEDVSAFVHTDRNLVTADGSAAPVRVAAMSAAGFRVARVLPLMGRTLIEEDEQSGAQPVIVIGYDEWRNRFGADPDVVGTTARLGSTAHTVVGVMPEGFRFPVSDQYWTALPLDPSAHERGGGPDLNVFGRLAPGVDLDQARAELTGIGQRTAAAFPETNEHLRPEVMPYTFPFFDIDKPETVWAMHLVQVSVSLLLVVICVNVAVLVYARTAMRRLEIAVRTALGASRRRVMTQLFVEALVLSTGAAVAGIVLAGVALEELNRLVRSVGTNVPFWLDFGLSPGSLIYVAGLTILAGGLVGVVPALRVTGPGVQGSLQRLAGGGPRLPFGGTWTALIVTQVAIAVAALPAAIFGSWQFARYGVADPGYGVEEFLAAGVSMDRDFSLNDQAEAVRNATSGRFARSSGVLVQRLAAEPGVSDVTFSRFLPGREPTIWVEVDGVASPAETNFAVRRGAGGHAVRFNDVDIGLFDAFDVPLLTGRRFTPADLDTAAAVVIVNRSFVERVFGDGNALGRRLSHSGLSGDAPQDTELGSWFEIVGVVSDFPNPIEPGLVAAKVYHPVGVAQLNRMSLALRVRGTDPQSFTGRVREVAAAVDPSLGLRGARSMDAMLREEQRALQMFGLGIGIAMVSVMLLSAAGIYALMSFTVTQRRKEIGIRTALGAHPHRILAGVFRRAAWQLAIGVAVGIATAALLEVASGGEVMGGEGAWLLPIVAVVMMVVGLAATTGPARRGLRIQPTEALREE